jgi:pyrimidine operon attenuation protein/uracil phosphoribosyltransferase
MNKEARLLESEEVTALIDKMSEELRSNLKQRGIENPLMIGIHTGGAWVANQLHQKLELNDPLGTLDISFYRDDFTQKGMHPQVHTSSIPFQVEDRHIILVDDVLQTGRTIRAALNEIFDFGRPASVTLSVLVDRGGRDLPIEAQIHGMMVDNTKERITLTGPDPLGLIIGQGRETVRAANL